MNKKKTLEEKQEKINAMLNSLHTNSYESIMVLKPVNAEEIIKNIAGKIKKAGYVIENTEIIGERDLCYELQGHSRGYYVRFVTLGSNSYKIDKIAREEDDVLKFITIRQDD